MREEETAAKMNKFAAIAPSQQNPVINVTS